VNQAVTIGRTTFANPVLAASGTFGFGLQYPEVATQLGGVVTKGITLQPRTGNLPPRIAEFPGGIINSVGLENPGIERFRCEVLPELRRLKTAVVVNIAGFAVDEYAELARQLDDRRVDALELNVSCPNVKAGGAAFGQSVRAVESITRKVRRASNRTLIVKLTANFVDPAETARAAEAAGADAVTVINTLVGMALDQQGRPFLGARTGGVSGPALKPFALFCVDRVAQAVKIPVIGCGGVMTGQDALDFLSAGASMVQVGTASLVDPTASARVWQELRALARASRVRSWGEIVGRARRDG
jgi:dihydroorotate dehydrogenase (NAD+) catalytic subunit